MAIFRDRLPTEREMLLGFAVCVVPVHIWLVINFLGQARGIVMRLSVWDFIGVVAYMLSFALLESLLLFLAIVILAFILPGRLYRHKFAVLSSVLVLLASAWFIFLHVDNEIIENKQWMLLALWAFSLALAVGGLFFVIHRSRKVEGSIYALAGRLAILALIYVFVDLMGVIIIIIRNV